MNRPFGKIAVLLVLVTVAGLLIGCAKEQGTTVVDIDEVTDITPQPGASTVPGNTQTVDPQSTVDPSATPDPNATSTPDGAGATAPAQPTIDPDQLDGNDDATPKPKLTYSEYQNLNSDVVGWISISDTNVDYPIVQSKDNEDYLGMDVLKEPSKSGAIFVDYRCNTGSKHVIIYGHNMKKSGTMFAHVNDYGNRSFYDSHRTFSIKFGSSTYTYKVFAVYSVDVAEAKYMNVSFGSDAEFAVYMNQLAELSQFPVDTEISPSDQVITLSTCNHANYSNGRFAVHAVRVG